VGTRSIRAKGPLTKGAPGQRTPGRPSRRSHPSLADGSPCLDTRYPGASAGGTHQEGHAAGSGAGYATGEPTAAAIDYCLRILPRAYCDHERKKHAASGVASYPGGLRSRRRLRLAIVLNKLCYVHLKKPIPTESTREGVGSMITLVVGPFCESNFRGSILISTTRALIFLSGLSRRLFQSKIIKRALATEIL
jgi:hypothetical protein